MLSLWCIPPPQGAQGRAAALEEERKKKLCCRFSGKAAKATTSFSLFLPGKRGEQGAGRPPVRP